MKQTPSAGWRLRFRCNERDVLEAFRATAAGIRVLTRTAGEGMTSQNAAYIADRLFEERELIRQIIKHRHWKRVRHLLSIHRRQRKRFLEKSDEHGFDVQALRERCRTHITGLFEH